MNDSRVSQKPRVPRVALERPSFHNLDLLRFVAALIVALYHLTVFFPDYQISGGVYADTRYVTHSIATLAFNGPAAVMLFFIVSGICIHAPYRGNRPLELREFYARRFIRIGIPLAVAKVLSSGVVAVCGNSALPVWSLWCEMAYYLIYPGLLVLIGRYGFRLTFLMSLAGALLLSFFHGDAYYGPWSHGPFLTWIIFLPVWLGGLWICENSNRPIFGLNSLSLGGAIALAGLTVFGVPALLMFLFKAHIVMSPLPLLYFFSLVCTIFIALAIRTDLSRFSIVRFMERQGRWSYSLYLVHFPLIYLGSWGLMRAGLTAMGATGLFASTAVVFAASIALSLVFYHFVENPSHLLAKRLGLRFRKRTPQIDVIARSVVK